MNKTVSYTTVFTAAIFFAVIFSCQKTEEEVSENGAGSNKECVTCVHYVKKVLGITGGTADALNWGTTYPIPNYSIVNGAPRNDDIIVITPELTEWSSTNSEFLKYGHIGFVKNLSIAQSGDLTLEVKGGNQSGSTTECECPKVSQLPLSIANNRRGLVRFYRNTTPSYHCPGFNVAAPTQTREIALSGALNFGNVIIGNAPTKPLTITNNGNSSLTVNSVVVPNGYTSDYSSGTIPAGHSTTANITFRPQNMVTNYNGTITVNSDANSGTSSISVTGSGVNGTPAAPTFSPTLNSPTGCSFANETGTGNCAGSTYLGNTIRMRAASYNVSTNTITFVVERCNGTFSNSGTAYIKQGNYCSSVVGQQTYGVGASSITITVTPPLAAGHYTYTAVVISATTDKFYSLSVDVQY